LNSVLFDFSSGKSTLIGVLTGGTLDNGRGLARSKVFIHAHELGTGRTSAISQQIMGFDENNKPVHQTVAASAQSMAKSKSWAQVVHLSRSIMTFIDLAGHEKSVRNSLLHLHFIRSHSQIQSEMDGNCFLIKMFSFSPRFFFFFVLFFPDI
jgi:GTPase